MQYFRNTTRRMTEYANPRDMSMFPLCRNDAEARTGNMRENQNGCGCSGNTRNTENERSGRCGCEMNTRNTEETRSERTTGCMNNRSERTGGCMNNNRNERADGCMNNNRNERTDGCMNNNRNERTDGCMNNNRNERTGGCMNNNRNERTDGCIGTTRSERMSGCGCGCSENENSLRCENSPTSENYGCTGLAMAFVPDQEFTDLNDAEEALCRGTLFRQLDMPFYGQRRRNCK